MSEGGRQADEEIRVAAAILRAGTGPGSAIRLLHCLSFHDEALAEWLERHPDDPRAARAAEAICRLEADLLDALLGDANGG